MMKDYLSRVRGDEEGGKPDLAAVAGFAIVLLLVFSLSIGASDSWAWWGKWFVSDKASGWFQALAALLGLPLAFIILGRQQRTEGERVRHAARLQERAHLQLISATLLHCAKVANIGRLNAANDRAPWSVHLDALQTCKSRLMSIPTLQLHRQTLSVAVDAVVFKLTLLSSSTAHMQELFDVGSCRAANGRRWTRNSQAREGEALRYADLSDDLRSYCMAAAETALSLFNALAVGPAEERLTMQSYNAIDQALHARAETHRAPAA